MGARCGRSAGNGDFAAVGAVPRRNAVTPPKLAGNAPVADIFKPMEIDLFKTLGNKTGVAVFHSVNRGAGQRFHFDEPLFRHARLDSCAAAIASTDVVGIIFVFDERTLGFQIFNNRFSRFVAVHAGIFRVIVGNLCVGRQHVDDFQIVAKPDLKVVGVVGGRNFHDAGSEIHFHVIVGNDRNFTVNKRQNKRFAHNVFVAFIVRVDGDRRIAQKGFGTRGGKFQIAASVFERIAQVPEVPRLFFIFHFRVGNGS